MLFSSNAKGQRKLLFALVGCVEVENTKGIAESFLAKRLHKIARETMFELLIAVITLSTKAATISARRP